MKQIAIVEDSPDNRLLLQAILEDRFQVVEYADGEAALAGLRRSVPDLVLMDISLPDMEGGDILHQMKQEPQLRDVPVVALTAHAMRGDRDRFLESGFDDYLTKPLVDEDVLLESIDRLLAARVA